MYDTINLAWYAATSLLHSIQTQEGKFQGHSRRDRNKSVHLMDTCSPARNYLHTDAGDSIILYYNMQISKYKECEPIVVAQGRKGFKQGMLKQTNLNF